MRGHTGADQTTTILLIEPSDEVRSSLSATLREAGLTCIAERDGPSGWSRFCSDAPGAVLAGVDLPGLHGCDLLARVREQSTAPVVFYSVGNDDAITAVSLIKAGADDFLVLPHDAKAAPNRLRALIHRHSGSSLRETIQRLIIGRSTSIARVREKILGLAELRVPVLIQGEEGSGCDHVARTLASIAEQMPHSKALVTIRASASRPPCRQDSDRVIYLDLVEQLPLGEQHLWALQIEGTGRNEVATPWRVIASTRADLVALEGAKRFDPLLTARLMPYSIALPPLRDRREDIPLLARHLADRMAMQMGRARALVTDPAAQLLRRQAWPGNVRELEAMVARLVAFARDGQIRRSDVLAALRERPSSVAALRESEDRRQRAELTALLAETGGNLAEVGRRLGMSRGAAIYRAHKFGLLVRRF